MEHLPQSDPQDGNDKLEFDFNSGSIRVVHKAVAEWLHGRDTEDMTPYEREIAEIDELDLMRNCPAGALIEVTSAESANVLAGVVCDYALHIGAEPIRRNTLAYAEAEDLAVKLMFASVPVKPPVN